MLLQIFADLALCNWAKVFPGKVYQRKKRREIRRKREHIKIGLLVSRDEQRKDKGTAIGVFRNGKEETMRERK